MIFLALPDALRVFEYPFMQRALVAALLIAVLAAVLGVYVVLRGQAMLGDGLAHISFAGIAIGLAAGIYPLGMALATGVVGALLIHLLQAKGVVKGDTAIGILFTAGLAVGILIVSVGPGFNVNIHQFLFGTLLAVSATDLWVVGGLGLVLVVLVTALGKELFALTFSPEAARLSGLPVAVLEAGFAAVTAATIVVSVRIVGVLLVSALLVVPAASALQWARSFRAARVLAVLFGVVGAFIGIVLSVVADVPSGAAIAVTTTALFALSAVAARARRA